MFTNLSDPVLGKLVAHPKNENWTGRVELRPDESVKLLISYSGGEDVDLDVEELLAFARKQLGRIRAGIGRFLRRAAKDIRREHPQRKRPGVRTLSEADLVASLKVASIQFTGANDTAILLTHPRLRGEVVVLLTPGGRVESVEF
jgi:hypothetical protein